MSSGTIYTGVWRDYGNGTESTLILTVTREVGAMLTAFLALFVSLSLGQLWAILCFVAHQLWSTPAARSGLHHQRQALLRNTPTPGAAAWTAAKLIWTWRGKIPAVHKGAIALVSMALSFLAVLAASSLLSSRVQLPAGDALFSGRKCGEVYWSIHPSYFSSFNWWLYDRAVLYSGSCYRSATAAAGSSEPNACADFPANKIETILSRRVVTSFVRDRNHNRSIGAAWDPIPELAARDADTTLLILRNDVRYLEAVQDPWFRATSNVDSTGAGRPTYLEHTFMADQISSTIACTEQYQFCNSTACSSLDGKPEYQEDLGVDLNVRQQAVVSLLDSISFGSLYYLFGHKPPTLRAAEAIGTSFEGVNDMVGIHLDPDIVSFALPPNQWHVELSAMFNATVAVMQLLAVVHAAPPAFDSKGSVMPRESERDKMVTESREMCARTRTRDARHSNFAFVPLVAILAAGATVIAVSLLCLPGAAFWLQRRLAIERGYQRREWVRGHLFMLQRAKFEAEGIGPWEVDEGGEIPWLAARSGDDKQGLIVGDYGPQPTEQDRISQLTRAETTTNGDALSPADQRFPLPVGL